VGAIATVADILADPWFETAAAFALGDMHKIMQEQFAVAPGISPNNNSMAKTYATRVVGDDAGVPRGFSQLAILGHRNPIDHQHSDFGTILHAGETRVGHVPRA